LQDRYKRKKIFDCSNSKDIEFHQLTENKLKNICYPKVHIEYFGDEIPDNEEIVNDRLDPVDNEDDYFGEIPNSEMLTADTSARKFKWTPEDQVFTSGRPSN
jgi:hypothetical protein